VSPATMGRDLRARRRALGLTQAEVAEAAGTRPVMVGRWERGEALPTSDEVIRLAEVLDLDPAAAAEWSAVAWRPAPTSDGPPNAPETPDPPEGRSRPQWLVRLSARASAWRSRLAPLRGQGGKAAFSTPGPRRPGESYLDDPVEQRRYAVRWALTLLVLGALAIGLVWALGELRQGWDAFLDLFRSRPPGAGPTSALLSRLIW
jgi:transcriptional regulator with XRE-family HTH domain